MSDTMSIYVGNETLVAKQCGTCGIWFAVPDWHEQEAKKNGPRGGWYCPNGHQRHYTEGEQERTRMKELERALAAARTQTQWERDQREATERSLRAQKGQVTKLKKRIRNGVCPCCNRSFKNVERHMKSQHPDFVAAPVVEGRDE